ncbi:MAG: XTP/dITP diphosphatase [Candidatus Anstonellales archaeon]
MSTLVFVTGNKGKFKEAKEFFSAEGIKIINKKLPIEERRGTLEEIAEDAAKQAYKKLRAPLFVEDSGLFIHALNGFPGEFSAWAFKKIGNEGILKLLGGEKSRRACFRSVIAYADGNRIKFFKGVCAGRIADRIRGRGGFGYDPIFIPEGKNFTFAEREDLKTVLSHRYNSLKKLLKFLKKRKVENDGKNAFQKKGKERNKKAKEEGECPMG